MTEKGAFQKDVNLADRLPYAMYSENIQTLSFISNNANDTYNVFACSFSSNTYLTTLCDNCIPSCIFQTSSFTGIGFIEGGISYMVSKGVKVSLPSLRKFGENEGVSCSVDL